MEIKRDSQPVCGQRITGWGVLSSKWDVFVTASPCKDQGSSCRRKEEDCKHLWRRAWYRRSQSTTEQRTTCIGHAQDHMSHDPRRTMGGAHKLSYWLLAINSCWRKEKQPQEYYPCSSWWPHTPNIYVTRKWLCVLKKWECLTWDVNSKWWDTQWRDWRGQNEGRMSGY